MIIIILLIFLFVIILTKRSSIFYEYFRRRALRKCKTCKHHIIEEYPEKNAFLCDYECYINIMDVPHCPSYEKKDDSYSVDNDIGLDLGIK